MLYPLIRLLAPDSCIGCNFEGSMVCSGCMGSWSRTEQCHICTKPSLYSITCRACRAKSPFDALYVVADYSNTAKELVHKSKYGPSKSAAQAMGMAVSSILPYLPKDGLVVSFVPTTGSRVRERGFDQSRVMSRELSRQIGAGHASLLARLTKSHQVGSGRKDRFNHMSNAFAPKNGHLIKGTTVLLVDDVYTTGATMLAAGRAMRKAGARRVLGAVFARAI
jgi:ComF family protein